ncbi:hypothetical protein GMOD_00005162 [Pyrenophora seminiperda CCB06]|uniref:DUF7918 domain-containing protein n=1 Tax=Pyrenophora seminiperda CCB06 TaxID=1302712 RepID=A0A3M7LV24_9PLEO|nr:hypothetical protein GMOD_00005162 [Pyrenophora seminiperda CCB06]
MAITEAHPYIKVNVQVGGIPLSSTSVTKYIEATSGAEFSVAYEFTPPWPKTALVLMTYVDGKWMNGVIIEEHLYTGTSYNGSWAGTEHTEGNKAFLRKFCFSELTIGTANSYYIETWLMCLDDSAAPTGSVSDNLMTDLKEIGEIKIKVMRVKNGRPSSCQDILRKDTKDLGEIPEKALKGRSLTHQSTLKPPVARGKARQNVSCDYIDSIEKPFAVYTFKYRSRAALQSLLIIPRSPSPVPLEDRDVDTLTAEESRELVRRLREQKKAAPPIKREDVKRKGVKREADNGEVTFVSEKRRRPPATVNENGIEIIDLT